jgi:hypothetical protein
MQRQQGALRGQQKIARNKAVSLRTMRNQRVSNPKMLTSGRTAKIHTTRGKNVSRLAVTDKHVSRNNRTIKVNNRQSLRPAKLDRMQQKQSGRNSGGHMAKLDRGQQKQGGRNSGGHAVKQDKGQQRQGGRDKGNKGQGDHGSGKHGN